MFCMEFTFFLKSFFSYIFFFFSSFFHLSSVHYVNIPINTRYSLGIQLAAKDADFPTGTNEKTVRAANEG